MNIIEYGFFILLGLCCGLLVSRIRFKKIAKPAEQGYKFIDKLLKEGKLQEIKILRKKERKSEDEERLDDFYKILNTKIE